MAWVGRDDNSPLGRGEWGGTAALGIWIDFMEEALADLPVATIKRPEGMVPVRIGLHSGEATQSRSDSRIEYIRDEYRLMTLGPDPVRYSKQAEKTPPRTAPRMLDELTLAESKRCLAGAPHADLPIQHQPHAQSRLTRAGCWACPIASSCW